MDSIFEHKTKELVVNKFIGKAVEIAQKASLLFCNLIPQKLQAVFFVLFEGGIAA